MKKYLLFILFAVATIAQGQVTVLECLSCQTENTLSCTNCSFEQTSRLLNGIKVVRKNKPDIILSNPIKTLIVGTKVTLKDCFNTEVSLNLNQIVTYNTSTKLLQFIKDCSCAATEHGDFRVSNDTLFHNNSINGVEQYIVLSQILNDQGEIALSNDTLYHTSSSGNVDYILLVKSKTHSNEVINNLYTGTELPTINGIVIGDTKSVKFTNAVTNYTWNGTSWILDFVQYNYTPILRTGSNTVLDVDNGQTIEIPISVAGVLYSSINSTYSTECRLNTPVSGINVISSYIQADNTVICTIQNDTGNDNLTFDVTAKVNEF